MEFAAHLDRVIGVHARTRCYRRALTNALAAFENSHRNWVESFFDLPFPTGRGAEALETGDPQALARAWTQQFRYRDESRRDHDIRRLTEASSTFIALLERATAGCGSAVRKRRRTAHLPV